VTKIFCTCIIPTVGRDSLSRAVESVLAQTLTGAEFEIVVVNDSGKALPKYTWQADSRVRIIHTNRRERSVARNTGAAMARGRYLHFLDDDDWIAGNAYRHLRDLSQHTDAVWLYGMTRLVTRQLKPTLVLQHGMTGNQFLAVMAGEWIPLQASLIERDAFLETGGFNPGLAGPEDIDLLRRIMLTGEMAETTHLIACVILGLEGSTTDYHRHSVQSRLARESILDLRGTFKRMQATAHGAFWQARLLRIYLTSVIWNLQNRRLFTAMSRAVHSLEALLTAGLNAFRWQFWSSVSEPFASPTFARGIEEGHREMAGNE
jgi:glycosyltransferase involved in cell wall biosynthesis